jgi:hypothetical protein
MKLFENHDEQFVREHIDGTTRFHPCVGGVTDSVAVVAVPRDGIGDKKELWRIVLRYVRVWLVVAGKAK